MPNERVAVYIDGSNLYYSLRHVMGRVDLDFAEFVRRLIGDRKLVRAYYYVGATDSRIQPQAFAAQQRFFEALRSVDYFELRLGRLVYAGKPPRPAHEKGVDVRIATDMVVHGSRGMYDTAILVSGDTDFLDAVRAVKDYGRHVEVALMNQRGSTLLQDVADRTIVVTREMLNGCWTK